MFEVSFIFETQDRRSAALATMLAQELPAEFKARWGLWRFKEPERFPTLSMEMDSETPLDAVIEASERVKSAAQVLNVSQPPALAIRIGEPEPADFEPFDG